jgi:hypothetical protein
MKLECFLFKLLNIHSLSVIIYKLNMKVEQSQNFDLFIQ